MNLIEQLGGYDEAKLLIGNTPPKATHIVKKTYLKLIGAVWWQAWEQEWSNEKNSMIHVWRGESIELIKEWGEIYSLNELNQEILKYRREHGIFEVGDLAVDPEHTGLLKVTRVMKKRVDVDYLNPQVMNLICHHSILIRHIRHATDEEIAAGHRL